LFTLEGALDSTNDRPEYLEERMKMSAGKSKDVRPKTHQKPIQKKAETKPESNGSRKDIKSKRDPEE
jgi:hypothetical protein